MTHALAFTEEDLRRLAGARSFERGVGYASAVSRLEIGGETTTVTVDGTDAYEVELTEDEDGRLSGWCDCPYGREGNFCKHCVAVGLAVLEQAGSAPRQRSAAASRTRLLDDWLESRTREELAALIREQLAVDRGRGRRLELRAATAGDDTAIVRERILSLLDTRPFASYGYVEYAYGQQAAEAVAALRALTAGGRAADAVEVAREALRTLSRTYGEIDDSDGLIGDIATGLAEAHLEACPPAPTRWRPPSGWCATCLAGGRGPQGRGPGVGRTWVAGAESEWGPDDELVAFVCDRDTRAGRLADVVTIHRDLLGARPSLTAYQHLRTAARTAGTWEGAERAGALGALRASDLPVKGRWYGGSVLVDALMDDADVEAAWQAAADGYADQRQ
ncbi:SWIM zinc finger domain-containing protein [Streptomyces sp. NBC_01006]|uniref:SWIM zinc finger family protein n=1 Tax=Streptomyces sp. NBC_01006 TaxID=2903716 RepID=UPI0038646764|nr:hypothetical protein OG509_02405 [Streptomyces sp. NBC_01006]